MKIMAFLQAKKEKPQKTMCEGSLNPKQQFSLNTELFYVILPIGVGRKSYYWFSNLSLLYGNWHCILWGHSSFCLLLGDVSLDPYTTSVILNISNLFLIKRMNWVWFECECLFPRTVCRVGPCILQLCSVVCLSNILFHFIVAACLHTLRSLFLFHTEMTNLPVILCSQFFP